jgi:small conductance mechanosensitive channel
MIRLAAASPSPAPSEGVQLLGLALKNVILLAVMLVGAGALLWVGRRATRRARARLDRADGADVASARRKGAITFAVVNVVRVAVVTILVFVALALLGVNIAPILASAGFVGAGLAFGAQSIVRDYLAGFYVLVEDQFSVGDTVECVLTGSSVPVAGVVVDLTLRRTAVRVRDGSVVSFGNGAIVSARNRSRGTGVLRVEVEVPARGTLAQMTRSLEAAVESMRREPAVTRLATSELLALGVEPTASGSVELVVAAETLPAHRGDLEQEIRTRLNRAFLGPEPAAVDDPAGGVA